MKHVKSKKGSELLGQILLWALLISALLVFSVPFFFMISNSFEEFSYVLPYPFCSNGQLSDTAIRRPLGEAVAAGG